MSAQLSLIKLKSDINDSLEIWRDVQKYKVSFVFISLSFLFFISLLFITCLFVRAYRFNCFFFKLVIFLTNDLQLERNGNNNKKTHHGIESCRQVHWKN